MSEASLLIIVGSVSLPIVHRVFAGQAPGPVPGAKSHPPWESQSNTVNLPIPRTLVKQGFPHGVGMRNVVSSDQLLPRVTAAKGIPELHSVARELSTSIEMCLPSAGPVPSR